jgi:hypothetical protein
VANVGAAALWAMSRTAGAPFGPHAGEPELVQAGGLCALLLEIYVVMGAGWVWYRGSEAEPIPAFANAMVFLGVGAVIAFAATAGVASGLTHGHHAPAGGGPDHHAPISGHADGHHEHPKPVTPLNADTDPVPAAPLPVEVLDRVTEPSRDTDGHHDHSE